MNRSLLALALGLAGCVAETSTFPSSRSLLAPTLSGATTAHGVDETGRELVRLFGIRDYAVADAYRDPATGERLLKLAKIDRASVADRAAAWPPELASIGSVFYVWIAPASEGSTIHLLGKPTLAGKEPCTKDGLDLPCAPLWLRADLGATAPPTSSAPPSATAPPSSSATRSARPSATAVVTDAPRCSGRSPVSPIPSADWHCRTSCQSAEARRRRPFGIDRKESIEPAVVPTHGDDCKRGSGPRARARDAACHRGVSLVECR